MANFFTRGQILLAGGHFLMPVIKWMNESRLSMEYWFSKKLDGLQQMVGLGNAKTKQNLESYDKVDALLEKGGQGETVELTPYMRSLLEQHSIGDDLKFEEEKESWGTMIKARLWSIASASVTNISLGLLSSRKIIKNWSYAESEERGGNWFHEKIMSKVPGFDHVVKDGGMWSRYVINDAILTAASAAAFHQTEKKAKAKKNAARTEQSDLPASDAPATSERTAPAHQPETEVKPSNHADRFAPAAAKHGERQTLRRETAEAVPQQI